MAKKKRRGRPKMPKDKARTARLQIRVSRDEEREIDRRAADAGLSQSEYVRKRALGEI